MAEKLISISAIDTRAAAARGFELELEYPRGTGLGVYLTVLGEHSEAVESFEIDRADKRAEEGFEAARKGSVKARTSREVLAENLESAVFRVVGWRGVQEEFSKDLLRAFLQRNPDFVDQVIAASRDRANFTLA